MAEAAGVQHACHADNLVVRQAGKLAQRPDHGIQRVGDADHEGVRRVGFQALAHGFHHFEVDAQKVIARHAGFARHTGGDDADVGPGDIGIGIGTFERGVKPLDRAGLRDVERLALRRTLGDVKQDDVAQFLDGGEMGKRAPDLPGTNQRDLRSGHDIPLEYG